MSVATLEILEDELDILPDESQSSHATSQTSLRGDPEVQKFLSGVLTIQLEQAAEVADEVRKYAERNPVTHVFIGGLAMQRVPHALDALLADDAGANQEVYRWLVTPSELDALRREQ